MVNIDHEIKINASPEKIFKALSCEEELKSWHTLHIQANPEQKSLLTFQATNKPVFLWNIVPNNSEKEVIWECIQGPGDSVGTKVIYKLSSTEDHRTLVELSHTSWKDQSGNFRKCNTLWGILLHHLKNYVETDKSDPAFS